MKDQIKVIGNGNGNGSINIYSPKKVAEILEVKESFVKRLLREGKLEGFKVGKFWRVSMAVLEAYCDACNQNGNGKGRVSADMRNKIKFHANLKSQDSIPNAIEERRQGVAELKEKLQTQTGYKKVVSIAKLRSIIMVMEEKQRKLDSMDVSLGELASKAYPEVIDLVDEDPDVLEELFKEAAKEPQKKLMIDHVSKEALDELSKGEAKQVQEEQAVGELNLADA